jgi:CheY-like chemotaxis protein
MSSGRTADTGNRHARVLFVYPAGPERDLYAAALRAGGFEVVVETGVRGAAARFEGAEPPDVIVMELLPEPDSAWAFVERRCADRPAIPVIILTSLIRPDSLNRRRARRLGCAAFVAKPCSLAQLTAIVSRVRQGERGLEISRYVEGHPDDEP